MKNNSKGVTAIEYGLIGALISIVIMGGVMLTGTDTKEVFCNVDNAISSSTDNDGDSSSGDSSSSSNDVEISKGFDSATVADLASQGITPTDLSQKSSGMDAFTTGTVLDDLTSMLSANGQTITGVSGLYDMDGNAITDFNTAYSLFHNNLGTANAQTAGGTTTDSKGFTDFFEVTTSDGQVYEIGNETDSKWGKHSAFMNKGTGIIAGTF